MGHLFQGAHYGIQSHATHKRLPHISLGQKELQRFMAAIGDVTQQRLSYVPYMRLRVADALQVVLGDGFAGRVRALVGDRATGGFTLSAPGDMTTDQQVALGTAISHLVGIPNFDDMSSNFYAIFEVRDMDTSDSYLRQAYRMFTLHTDGTYVEEATDWILMMKMGEQHALGGESRVLHLDDWGDLARFSEDPLASHAFDYKSPPSKNYSRTVKKTTFYQRRGRPCVCFIDQFVYPETVQEANYLSDLSASMEGAAATVALPVNHLLVLNNHFWLHGRAPFVQHPDLRREMMRQRGYFRTGEVW
ncbi:MAG: glutarate dioxygenase GlaH [bacterium]|jgi:glutarate dioxygenase|nr:glutarate dioxygenase GlaH [bacterium]